MEVTTIGAENDTVEHKVDVAVESMIYTFLGVLIAAVVIGVAIGGLCLLCCMRCYQRGQKRRLSEAQKNFSVAAPKVNSVVLDAEGQTDLEAA
jgi:multisubunit Na+/H+ antiporter MnhC subunit